MKEPEISVGIVSALAIQFTLNGHFTAKGSTVCDRQDVAFHEGGILWNGNIYHELTFSPLEKSCSFSLENVTIGIGFHWERQETQVFPGILKLVVHEGKIAAINLLPAEVYLESVISSEMNATAPLEFLKAHAVISRSWLLAQIQRRKQPEKKGNEFFSFIKTENEYLRWYDREEHTIFDVCADDHCQRYQGITKATNPNVSEAVRTTSGEVLTEGGEICDARFPNAVAELPRNSAIAGKRRIIRIFRQSETARPISPFRILPTNKKQENGFVPNRKASAIRTTNRSFH